MPDSSKTNVRDPSVHRLRVLDGWRGISIIFVLVGHMLPLGPKSLKLNSMVSAAGLSIFFFLSGFLVVSMLLRNDNVVSFFVRRLFRILPLAWLALPALLIVHRPDGSTWYANLLFYSNLVRGTLLPHGDHLWSLSVEVQFYVAVGLTVGVLGRRALYLVPVACLGVTWARTVYGMEFSILTWFRIDEILAGGTVALLARSAPISGIVQRLPTVVPVLLLLALFASCHESLGPFNYMRAYVTALLVYSTIQPRSAILEAALTSKPLGYLAKTSYALYVIHPMTYSGWLGEGDVLTRYAKRILSVVLTFSGAHLSSMYYEKHWNELGHRLALRIEQRQVEKSLLRSRQAAS